MKNGLVIDKDGTKIWYLNGDFHRVDGPAIEFADGSKLWYLNGKPHREDGPAEEWVDGSKLWWLNGEELNHPEVFENMEAWIEYLNVNEEQTYQVIHDINGIIGIKNPSGKQVRVHQMAHLL